MGQIIKTTGETIEVSPKKGKYFSLQELQTIVGGYIEMVYLDDSRFMVVNEEGKLKNLPLNEKATELFNSTDYIVGDVLVCSRKEID